ncbi:MAG: NAD-dependent epimerase [Bradymonadaceae bacterium]
MGTYDSHTTLVTGAAGFIGYHVAERLVEERDGRVVGLDNLNDYYDPTLKRDRLAELTGRPGFEFVECDLEATERMARLFGSWDFDVVVHLAAQAGVRHSLEHPHDYCDSNLLGFLNILEGARHGDVDHLVFASSSSVYGANTAMPLRETDTVDHPVSLYAATKKSNELMAHAYADLYDLPATGLRFFTVYGPWGRPDMALFLFTDAILDGEPIDVFNYGDMERDFTYVDDIVDGIVAVMDQPPDGSGEWSGDDPNPATSYAPYRIFNIGNNEPVDLMVFIETLEDVLGREADKNFMPMQSGDVKKTYADVSRLEEAVDYSPDTPIREGIEAFVDWYRAYYGE